MYHLPPQHLRTLAQVDPDIAQAIADETTRQKLGLEMIASENYTSPAVMAAAGSVLTNKYAEGYPGQAVLRRVRVRRRRREAGHRPGEEALRADHANVQPHSGAQANMAVFLAALQPGDTILGLDLAHGGHLTHGMRLNFSGKYFKVVAYGVRRTTDRIDFDDVARQAREHKPKLIIAGASAYPREIDFAQFARDRQGGRRPAHGGHGPHRRPGRGEAAPDPVPHADFVTTTTHKTLRGPRGGFILCKEEWAKKIDSAVFPGVQGGPLMHVIAAKAVRSARPSKPEFSTYAAPGDRQREDAGRGAARAGFRIVSGGTDNHLMLVDVTAKGVTGKQAEHALDAAGITVNKNMIPFDTRKPLDPSGIRIGTPALTTRGMGEAEMDRIGDLISAALTEPENETALAKVKGDVEDLCREFPLYPLPA